MAVCRPRQLFVAADAADLVALKAYLDSIGYTVGTSSAAVRTDDGFTVTVDYPEWTLAL